METALSTSQNAELNNARQYEAASVFCTKPTAHTA